MKMTKLQLWLFSLLMILHQFTTPVLAQGEHNVPKEKWSKALYLSDKFCATQGLKPGEVNDLLMVWNNLEKNAKFSRVVDIRMYFTTPAEAASYLAENMKQLSENGEPVKEKVEIPGAANLRVFTESESMRKMNKSLGLKLNMYFFIFTVDNYLAKVFISSEKDIKVSDASVFAMEAAHRLNEAVKK